VFHWLRCETRAGASPLVTLGVSPVFSKNFERSQGFPGVREMEDAREYLLPAPNYNTPVKDLVYKDLLTSTFNLLARKGLSHRAKNHYQHRVVLIENVSWKCRQKSEYGE
jgi:hypothetical protein